MPTHPERASAKIVACIGAGQMGATLARHLCRSYWIDRLVIADLHAEAAAGVADTLRDIATCEVTAERVDVLAKEPLEDFLTGVDFVVNTAGPFFRLGVPTLTAAIATGTPYLDICDDPEPTRAMLQLGARAEAEGVGAVIGMGASPGVSNLLARRAADCLDEVIDCYTAWPLDVDEPGDAEEVPLPAMTGGAVTAAVVHLMAQISGTVHTVVDGQPAETKPLEPVLLRYPRLGVGTAWTVGHPEPMTLHASLNVRGRAANLMLVKPATAHYLRRLSRQIDAGRLTLEEAAREILKPSALGSVAAALLAFGSRGPGRLPPFFALLNGTRDGARTLVGCRAASMPPGMAGATSIPAALAVEMLLAAPAPPGVHPPETAIDANALLDRLRRYCPGAPGSVDELAPITEEPMG